MKINSSYIYIFSVIAILSCSSISVSAQSYFSNSPINDSLVKVNGIAEIDLMEAKTIRKKINTFKKVYQFDQHGKNTLYSIIEDSVKQLRIQYQVLTSFTTPYNHGSCRNSFWYGRYTQSLVDYLPDGSLKAWHYYKNNGKSTGSYEYSYNDSHLQRLNYFDKKHQLAKYYIYEYASNKKLKHTGLYTAKGKLIRYWDYNCDDEGKIMKNPKDTLRVCTIKSYLPDGTVITTTNNFDFRGNPNKQVEYTNAAGKQTAYMTYRGKDEMLTYKLLATYKDGKLSSKYIWNGNSKGKAINSYHYTYDANEKIVTENDSFWNGRKIESLGYQYTYNHIGLPIMKKGFENGKMIYYGAYHYRYYRKD